MAAPRNEFERLAAASQAAEDSRPPSRWQRVWVAVLAAVCLLQWSSLLVAFATGWKSMYAGAAAGAIGNTLLLVVFVRRLQQTGNVLKRRERR